MTLHTNRLSQPSYIHALLAFNIFKEYFADGNMVTEMLPLPVDVKGKRKTNETFTKPEQNRHKKHITLLKFNMEACQNVTSLTFRTR